MKKLFITLLLLIPVDVFAIDILDFDLINTTYGQMSQIDNNYSKLSNSELVYINGTDYNSSSSSSVYDYVAIPLNLNIYYLYTESYSQDWTDTDTVLLQTTTATSTTPPSSYAAGQIACKIQHNYESTTATTTAMSCNYLGKNYTMNLESKSHYREHEFDYESILNSYRFVIQYSDNSSFNCSYVSNQYMICPYKKGTTIRRIRIFTSNSSSKIFYTSTLTDYFMFINKTTSQQFNQIMDNDTSSYNSGIQNIAGNTQLPNNSGLFDVLSSLSQFIGNLSVSGSCTPINVPIPFTNDSLRLPCMTTEVYAPNFPELLAIWQLIVRGVVYYYIIVNLLKLLKDTIDPFNMKLEVLDL